MDKKDERRIKLAKIFYEMGMEEDLILKVSGVSKKTLEKVKKNSKKVDKK